MRFYFVKINFAHKQLEFNCVCSLELKIFLSQFLWKNVSHGFCRYLACNDHLKPHKVVVFSCFILWFLGRSFIRFVELKLGILDRIRWKIFLSDNDFYCKKNILKLSNNCKKQANIFFIDVENN